MVTIQTKGVPRETRATIVAATRFYVNRLLPRRRKDITILIEMVPSMLEEQGFHGTCMPEDVDVGNAFFNEFTISIHKDFADIGTILTTLAHECVHLRQFAKGELRFTNSSFYNRWKGEMIDLVMTKYDDLPWEIEATALETVLVKEWIDTLVDGKFIRTTAVQV